MTLWGWDASDFDWNRGPVDLAAAARAGIQFFTHKATEATNVKHIHFGEAMARARDAGIPVLGAYHVVRSPRNARDEVDYFLNYVDRSFPEWRGWPTYFIQVDLEKWPYDAVPAAEGEDFADIAEAQSRKRALIYASKGQYGDALTGTSHELWNANYPLGYRTGTFLELYRLAGGDRGPGWSSYSGKTPAIWQYTSSAVIGSQNQCDANAYRGTLDQFRALLGGDDVALTDQQSDALNTLANNLPALIHAANVVGAASLGWNHTWDGKPIAFMDLLTQVAGQPPAQLTAEQATAMTDVLGDKLAAALVARPETPLGEADMPAIRAALRAELANLTLHATP